MLIADTQIFTNSGWKVISDISGNDKVLVRNFIGDAEFIQPFALQKKQYDGKIIRVGAKDWSFSVTPDHTIIYTTGKGAIRTVHTVPASKMKARKLYKFDRKFKYMFSEDFRKEYVRIPSSFGERTSTISDQDWYKLVGFVLTRGYIYTERRKPMLWLFIEEDRMNKEISILADICERIGVTYHVQYSDKTRPKFVVSSMNTLVARLQTRLGSTKRKYMSLPDKMVYNSSKELTKLLIDTIIDTSIKTTEKTDRYQLSTTNLDLIHSLELMGTLGGYSMRHQLKLRAGAPMLKGETKRDSYILHISAPNELYTPSYVKKTIYSGYVYSMDLFDGQIYVKQGLNAVWVNPK